MPTKIKRKIYSRRTKKNNNSKKHQYFIINCNFDYLNQLDNSFLIRYLEKLGIQPDNAIIQYDKYIRKFVQQKQLTMKNFCQYKNKILPPVFKTRITADVFFYIEESPFLNTQFFKVDKYLANTLEFDYKNQLNKDVIYKNIFKINPMLANKYFIEVFKIDDMEKYDFTKDGLTVYILRPIEAWGGMDIKYVHNKEELNEAIQFYNTTNFAVKKKLINYGNNVIASKFITNLLTFKKKKFHLRIHYMVTMLKGILNSFVLLNGEIITAAKPYDLELPFTKDKHDTHSASTIDYYQYPNDFTTENIGVDITLEKINHINRQIREICGVITKLIATRKDKLLYVEQKNGYYLFGLDILVKDDFSLSLIECNNNPSMGQKNKDALIKVSKLIYGWINDVVLEPLFKYNDPMRARKHSSYIDL